LISLALLPSLNATLNATSAACALAGYFFIRRRQIKKHVICMLSAFTSSTLFLVSYLVYHFQVGSVPFQGEGAVRSIYLAILISHILLAVVIVPLVLKSLSTGLRSSLEKHRRVARWTLPLWLYVSVTGVVVYWMLYRL